MYVYGNHKRIKCLTIDDVMLKCSENILDNSKYIFNEIFEGFKNVCLDYAEKVNEDAKVILMTDTAIKRYETGTFMGSHFDQQEGDQRLKYSLVMYLNDDYEEGGINIIEISDDKEDLINHMYYKPNAGDLIMFPSGHPFYHSPMVAKGGSKALIRAYWRYDYPGSEAWHSEKAQPIPKLKVSREIRSFFQPIA